MASWVNIKASESLLAELDIAFPNRDHASDGTIGDAAHRAHSSDHNPDDTAGSSTPGSDSDHLAEVHARDIDSDLKRPGWTMQRVFEIIRKRCETGQEVRVQNMICDGRITSRTWGWSWRAYGGADPHIKHGHIGFRYGSGDGPANPENITGPWGVLTAVQQEAKPVAAEIDQTAAKVWHADGILNNPVWRKDSPARGGTNAAISAGTALVEAMGQAHAAWVAAAEAHGSAAAAEAKVSLLLADPHTLPDPETHPLVKVLRYVLTTPAPATPAVQHLTA